MGRRNKEYRPAIKGFPCRSLNSMNMIVMCKLVADGRVDLGDKEEYFWHRLHDELLGKDRG